MLTHGNLVISKEWRIEITLEMNIQKVLLIWKLIILKQKENMELIHNFWNKLKWLTHRKLLITINWMGIKHLITKMDSTLISQYKLVNKINTKVSNKYFHLSRLFKKIKLICLQLVWDLRQPLWGEVCIHKSQQM